MEKSQLSCGAALGIVAGLVSVGLFVWKFPTETDEWAAWVQAFGSIGAIGAMGYIFNAQRKSERVNAERDEQHEQLRVARQVQRVAYWSVEAMKEARESCECGGASQGLPFRPERLDQLRNMLERVTETRGTNATALMALAFCNQLNKAYLSYKSFDERYRDIWLDSMTRCIQESDQMHQNILAYEQRLEDDYANFKPLAS